MARVKKVESQSLADVTATIELDSKELERKILELGSKTTEAKLEESKALLDTIESADKETDISNARAAMFESANAPQERAMDLRMVGLVERTFRPLDWEKILDRFDAWMTLGNHRTEEQFIRRAHEEGPEIVKDVYDVYLQVRFARESWELENDTMLGSMREEASKVLEREKERKIRTKTITIDDVTHKAASMFPDEFAEQEKRRLQFKMVEDRSKQCVELGATRCRVLDTMMNRLRVT